jgi:ADP-ribosylglycohydrolase
MNASQRYHLALDSLRGLAIGDAFGERFFVNPGITRQLMDNGAFYKSVWHFTDDTNMALSIVETLARFGEIRQDDLARSFAEHYESWRGYGPAMHRLLQNIRMDVDWRVASKWLFNGNGSYGNGAAMRVAPLGAYFCDDPQKAAQQARLSAEVTHAHPEGIAGAIAVTVAAAFAARREADSSLFDFVLPHVPDSEVRIGLERARKLGTQASVRDAVLQLGNGSGIAAHDTVPFCLWCAARHLDNYEEALWKTVSAGGDRDTNCAIVGGIVASGLAHEQIPLAWRHVIEGWPYWFDSVITEMGGAL